MVAMAIVPATALNAGHNGAVVAGGLALAALCVLAAALLRFRVGYLLGSAVQVMVLACGAVLPAMYILGGLFTVLWVSAILVARRAARVRAARIRTHQG